MGNELHTSGGFTFAQHQALAQLWCQWNGQRGTEKQSLALMYRLDAPTLHRLLLKRGVQLPLGVAPKQEARP